MPDDLTPHQREQLEKLVRGELSTEEQEELKASVTPEQHDEMKRVIWKASAGTPIPPNTKLLAAGLIILGLVVLIAVLLMNS